MIDALQLESQGPAQTIALGAAVARLARPGDVIALIGELGAGKTQFVRGMAAGLGMPQRVVSSPTFVIMHEYQPDGGAPLLAHIDAYRLQGPDELRTVGWNDARYDAITAVEWADRVAAALGDDVLKVRLTHAERGRLITISPHGAWSARMPLLERELQTMVRS